MRAFARFVRENRDRENPRHMHRWRVHHPAPQKGHWRDLAYHFMPRRSRLLDAGERTNNGEVMNHLEDDIGILALRTLASGMQSGLTSPARPWFSLTLQDEPLVQYKPVKEWLHEFYERMVNVFARSNFYDQIHMLYRERLIVGPVAFSGARARSLICP